MEAVPDPLLGLASGSQVFGWSWALQGLGRAFVLNYPFMF